MNKFKLSDVFTRGELDVIEFKALRTTRPLEDTYLGKFTNEECYLDYDTDLNHFVFSANYDSGGNVDVLKVYNDQQMIISYDKVSLIKHNARHDIAKELKCLPAFKNDPFVTEDKLSSIINGLINIHSQRNYSPISPKHGKLLLRSVFKSYLPFNYRVFRDNYRFGARGVQPDTMKATASEILEAISHYLYEDGWMYVHIQHLMNIFMTQLVMFFGDDFENHLVGLKSDIAKYAAEEAKEIEDALKTN